MARTLPHNNEAEAAILGGILLRGQQALNDVLDIVSEDDFYNTAHQAIFKAMKVLDDRREPLDVVMLEAQLKAVGELKVAGGLEALNKLGDRYATSQNIVHHAELVRRASMVRNLVVTAREVAEEGMEELENPNEFIDQAEKRIMAVNERGRRTAYQSSAELLKQIFVTITERAKRQNPITGVATHFTDLDKMTGGMQPGDLVIIAARPSMGKTAFVLNLAQNACVPQTRHLGLPEDEQPVLHPVLFFSLEMGATQLVERVLCSEAKVDYSKLRSGAFIDDDFRRMIGAADRISQARFFIDDQASPSILEMRARARRFREDRSIFTGNKEQYGLIIVDYLQLARGGKSRYDSPRTGDQRDLPRPEGDGQGAAHARARALAAQSRRRQPRGPPPPALRPPRVGRDRAGRRRHHVHLSRRALSRRRRLASRPPEGREQGRDHPRQAA
jgi:replicative DNA helicase